MEFGNFREFLFAQPVDSPIHDLHRLFRLSEIAMVEHICEDTLQNYVRRATALRSHIEDAGFAISAMLAAYKAHLRHGVVLALAVLPGHTAA